ncbi:MAG TPA: nucleoside-diphosphate sugar epimerase/dehydratase [Halanaerobiales bacterium]|nr:nucleoside-diphosphate sugar epimerase/dehydratase [Halanaerobiales bacterium]
MLEYLERIYRRKPALIIIDIILLNLALFISFILRFNGDVFNYLDFTYFMLISSIGLIILLFSNLYNRIWQYASIGELLTIFKVSALINLLLVFYIYISRSSFPRSVILINFMTEIFMLGALRFGLRLLKDYSINNNLLVPRTRVLIIGAGDAGEIIIREMNKHPELGKKIIGLIDDDPGKADQLLHGVRVLGNRYDISMVINRYAVDEVIIAMPSVRGKDIKEIYNLSIQNDVRVKIVPGVYELINGNVNLSQIREVKVEDLLGREQVKLDIKKIARDVEGRTVMVTGAGGSIGSELCRQIARFKPWRLLMLDNYENSLYYLDLELKKGFPDIEIIPIISCVRDKERLDNLFASYRPDLVFHAAAHKHVPLMEYNPGEAVKNNIFGTRNLLEVADRYKVDKFVLISTDKAVNPTNVMGATKRVAEMLVQAMNKRSQTKYMAVRFGNVLGSNGSVIPLFKKQIATGGPVTVTHEEVTRYFMTIPEAVQLVIQAAALGRGGEVFVLDMGEPVKIIDLAKDLIKLSGLKLGEDIDIEITGLRPGEKLYEELLHDTENNISTEHERIFITRLEEIDDAALAAALEDLWEESCQDNAIAIIRLLMDLVETYKPNRKDMAEMGMMEAYDEIASS